MDENVLTPLLARIVSSMAAPSVRREFFVSDDNQKSGELELELPLLLIGGEPVSLRRIMPSFNAAVNVPAPKDDNSDNDADADVVKEAEEDGDGMSEKEREDSARVGALEDLARRLRVAGAVPQPPKRRKGGK